MRFSPVEKKKLEATTSTQVSASVPGPAVARAAVHATQPSVVRTSSRFLVAWRSA